jgi:hypothetical protein
MFLLKQKKLVYEFDFPFKNINIFLLPFNQVKFHIYLKMIQSDFKKNTFCQFFINLHLRISIFKKENKKLNKNSTTF